MVTTNEQPLLSCLTIHRLSLDHVLPGGQSAAALAVRRQGVVMKARNSSNPISQHRACMKCKISMFRRAKGIMGARDPSHDQSNLIHPSQNPIIRSVRSEYNVPNRIRNG